MVRIVLILLESMFFVAGLGTAYVAARCFHLAKIDSWIDIPKFWQEGIREPIFQHMMRCIGFVQFIATVILVLPATIQIFVLK